MKTLLSRLFAIGVLMLAILSSCREDEATSKAPLLTGKSWTLVGYTIAGADAMEECLADNSMIFFSDGGYVEEIGLLACEETETNTQGSWTFKANETIISLHPAGDIESDWKVVTLTKEQFIISQYIELFDSEFVITLAAN